MYRTNEERKADWKALARAVGPEEFASKGRGSKPPSGFNIRKPRQTTGRHATREYIVPAWMFDDRTICTFLDDHFPKCRRRTVGSLLQNHWRNGDHQYWQAQLWLMVIYRWFRYGMTERMTASIINQGRIAWLGRMNYQTSDRTLQKITVTPSQIAKIVEHIKNVAAGWSPEGKTCAERIRNTGRQNGSPRVEPPMGWLEDSKGNRVDLRKYGNVTRAEVAEALQKFGKRLRGRPRKEK